MLPSPADVRAAAKLAERVCRQLGWPSPTSPGSGVTVGPLELNDFSACFWIDRWGSAGVEDGVYVKLPKHRLCYDRRAPVFPLDAEDVARAREEFASLKYLEGALGDSPIRFVTGRALLEADGAVVTGRVRGHAAFRDLRRWDRAAAAGDGDAMARLERHMADLGRMVAHFHRRDIADGTVDIDATRSKLRAYARRLELLGVRSRGLEQLSLSLDGAAGSSLPSRTSRTLKGIDVRNLLWSSDGQLVCLDPGALKQAPVEADLARFLVTLRVLYWGSPSFALGRQPAAGAELAFLRGYGPDTHSSAVLSWYLLKEVLKHWLMAHTAVDVSSIPGLLRPAVRRWYVNRPYEALLARALRELPS